MQDFENNEILEDKQSAIIKAETAFKTLMMADCLSSKIMKF